MKQMKKSQLPSPSLYRTCCKCPALEVCPPTCNMGIALWNAQIASKQRRARSDVRSITGPERDGNPVRMRETCMTPVKLAPLRGLGPPAVLEGPNHIAQFVEL